MGSGGSATPDRQQLQRVVSSLFPDEVVSVVATEPGSEGDLHTAELPFIERAIERRRREFAAGRRCARLALAELGVHDFPLLPGPDRAPLWPDGIVGSISHCGRVCVAVVASARSIRGLGVDVEVAAPLGRELLSMVCRPDEREALARLAPRPGLDWPKLVFSAKESFYKCRYPRLRRFLDFLDVEIQVRPEREGFRARIVTEAPAADVPGGRYAVWNGLVFTAVTDRPSEGLGEA